LKPLNLRDQHAVLHFLRAAYAIRAADDFVQFVLDQLPALIRSDLTSYNEMAPRERRSRNRVIPRQPPERDAAWLRVMHEHPVMNYYLQRGSDQVRLLSDFLTKQQLRNMALYSEHYGPLGQIYDVIGILWGSADALNGIGLHRTTQFAESDRALVNFLRPHLIQAHANAAAFSKATDTAAQLQRALNASGRTVIVLGRDRTVKLATASARDWVSVYLGLAESADRLPEPLDLWVRQHDSALQQILELPDPRDPLVIDRGNHRLIVRLLSGETELLLLLEEQNTRIEPTSLRPLGLTARENEVLALMANGRSNGEIARALSMRPRTVEAHLEHIYQQLRVSSRTAAAALAFRASRIVGVPPAH
jgi:DNA-binding CsgD family transcriptional regulator